MRPSEAITVGHQDYTFDVNASLSNGKISSIEVDEDFTSIILAIETNDEDGVLSITLPRTLIDSRQGNSTAANDDKFIVVVANAEVEYEETTNSNDSQRELRINVPAGTTRIEIVGTQVVPEFPAFMIGTLGAILGVTIAFLRKRIVE